MLKNSVFGMLILIVGIMLVFGLAGCGDNGDPTSPPGEEEGTLTGSVSIGGIPKYTHRIWADTSSLGGTGTISYQWIRGTSTSIGTGVYYDITSADIGQTLKVRVSRSEETGTKTSVAVSPVYHKIGDEGPAGGIVYYIDNPLGYWLPDGKQYIEIASNDVSASLAWGLNGTEIAYSNTIIGTGKICHDSAIAAGAGAGTAVGACDAYSVTLYNGALWERTFTDWFLPGLGELTLMLDYQEKLSGYYSGLSYDNTNPGLSGMYWTSTSLSNNNDTQAYYVGFFADTGHTNYGSLPEVRTVQNKARAIRWF